MKIYIFIFFTHSLSFTPPIYPLPHLSLSLSQNQISKIQSVSNVRHFFVHWREERNSDAFWNTRGSGRLHQQSSKIMEIDK